MEEVVKGVVGNLVEKALSPVVRAVEYTFYYKSKVASLQKETKDLKNKLTDVKGLIDDAKRNGRDILQEPINWVNESEKKLEDVANLLKVKPINYSCCPFNVVGNCNCKHRYEVADKAVKLLEGIDKLMSKGSAFNESNVSKRARPQRLPSTFADPYESLPSMEGYLDTLKGWLVGDEKREIIGVYGLKGAGKTLLVKKLAAELDSDQHDGEVDYVVYMSAVDGLESNQQLIADRVGLVMQHEHVQERGVWLAARLVEIGNVVLIIDDVPHGLIDLKKFGIPWSDRKKNGCRIVVVSSSLNTCKQMNTMMELKVEPLSKEDSLHLFKKLVKPGQGTSNTFQTGIHHISSKSTWLARDLNHYYNKLYFGDQQPETESRRWRWSKRGGRGIHSIPQKTLIDEC